jgi:hypothetical protein
MKSTSHGYVAPGLKGGTESWITAAQYQALSTCYHQRNIMKQPTNNKCRMFYKAEKPTKHIVAGCPTLAPCEYNNRHYYVAGYIHWTISQHVGLQGTDKYYKHVPKWP